MTVDGKLLTKFILYFSMMHIGISYSGFISLPNSLLYLTDIALIVLVVLIVKRLQLGVAYNCRQVKAIVIFIFVIMFYNILTGVINVVSPIWLLRGIRGALRFYVLCIGMIFYWGKSDVYQFFDWMVKLYPINFGVIVIQKVLWGENADSVIGITGTCLPVYMTFVLAYMVVAYMKKYEPLWKVVVITLINFLIATWGDQRGYYFMFAAIVVSMIILERISVKKTITIITCIAALGLGLYIMSVQAPESFKTLMDLDSIYEYGTRTSGGYNISRFGAFNEINDLFFHDNVLRNLIGYGLGFCEVNSPFYNAYGWLHYTWFTHQWTFLELGYIGIILLTLYFVLIFIVTNKNIKYISSIRDQICVETSAIICVVALVTIMYFSMHRSNSGFFLYAIVAMIPVMLRCEND